jgi:homoprotocatechuate degradation regulator HpaR
MNTPKRPVPYAATIVGLLIGAREALMVGIRPILRDADFTEAQWRILRVLFDKGPCDQARLALAAQLHAPSVSRILKELGERRLIVREPNRQDPRRSSVVLSEAGQLAVTDTSARIAPLLEFCAMRFGRKRFAALQQELAAFTLAVRPQVYDEPTALPSTGTDFGGETG